MRNIKILATLCFAFIIAACSVQENDQQALDTNDFTIKATLETGNQGSISKNKYAINIDITDKITKTNMPTIVHTFISYDLNEDISNLPEKFSTFNGIFEITSNKTLISQSIIKDGVVVSNERFYSNRTSSARGDYACSVDGITSCADDEINDMNWIEYAFCAVGAPACLAELYASCIYENCGNSTNRLGGLKK